MSNNSGTWFIDMGKLGYVDICPQIGPFGQTDFVLAQGTLSVRGKDSRRILLIPVLVEKYIFQVFTLNPQSSLWSQGLSVPSLKNREERIVIRSPEGFWDYLNSFSPVSQKDKRIFLCQELIFLNGEIPFLLALPDEISIKVSSQISGISEEEVGFFFSRFLPAMMLSQRYLQGIMTSLQKIMTESYLEILRIFAGDNPLAEYLLSQSREEDPEGNSFSDQDFGEILSGFDPDDLPSD